MPNLNSSGGSRRRWLSYFLDFLSMKKSAYLLFWLFAVVSLASCKKSYPDYQVMPTTSIVFDDLVDKTTADYKIGSTLTLKISAPGTTSVSIISSYPVTASGTTTTVSQNLGTFQTTNGVVSLSIPANSLRATANGTPVGAPAGASAAVRTANTYTLTVDAADGTNTSRRFYTAVLVQ